MKFSSTCPNCSETLYRDDVHCPKCGSRRSELVLGPDQLKGATRALEATSAAGDGEVPTCSSCGAPRLTSDFFCAVCGMPMADEVPAPTGEEAPAPPAAEAPTPTPAEAPTPPAAEKPTPPASEAATSSTPETPAPAEELDGWSEVRHQLEEATLGEFEIIKELGRGGMAAVYSARDLALDRNVAIKVMAPGLLMGPGMVDRFRQEAVTIANLNHRNIITIHTVRQAGSLHFFVMQEVEGGSLEGVVERPGPLPIALVQAILYQIGTGLAHAHSHGVIHRDIKPANVLLDREGNAILTDFGIAKVTTASNLTQTGSTIGTPSYMSPEQCRAVELTNASDQYSLGVVGYEMLVGSAPFDGSPFEIMQAHNSTAPRAIRDQRPDCPPELEAAILMMMAKDPAERFPSVAEAIEAVGGYVPGPGDPLRRELARLVMEDAPERTAGREALTPIPAKTPVPTPVPGTTKPAPKTRRRARLPLLIGGGVGLAAIVTVAVLSSLSNGSGEPEPTVQEQTSTVSTISFPNSTESLVVGSTVRVRAQVEDATGLALTEEPVTWSSDDPAVASVEGTDQEVVVTALAAGEATITAAAGGMTGGFTVMISEPAVGELTVTSPRRELAFGERLTLTGVLTDDSGQRVTDPEFAWSSSDTRVVEVDPGTGVATATGLGRARITAAAGDRTGSVSLTVVGRVDAVAIDEPADALEAGGTAVLRARVTSQPAGYLSDEGITWGSSNPSVASVSITGADSAVLTLLAEGETILTAQVGSVQNAVTLRVSASGPAVSLSLSSTAVSFEAMEGGEDPQGQNVGVTVTGDASPTVGAVQYQGGGRDWLSTELGARTGGTTTLSVRAEVGSLTVGTYSASLPISAGEGVRVLNVQFTVAPNPATAPVEPNREAEQGVSTLLTDYASAINTKNTTRVRELFPSISQDAIDDLLGLRETDTYLLQLVPGSLRAGSQERTLDGDVMTSVLGQGNRGEAARIIYTFGRGAEGWYVVALRAGG